MFNFLFNKINQSSTSAKASKDPNIKSTTTLEESISNIENILQIKSPKLQKVACLYDEGGLVQCQFELAPNTLPTNAHYYAAYYLDDADIIYFSAYRIKSDHNKNSISFSHQIYEIFVCLLSEKSDSKILKIDNIFKIGPKNL